MTTKPSPFTVASFPAQPDLECDIIMKGGITSGVIYPLAVCELARTYRLHSVGGSSAGAIAAAAAAAAEVGRRTSAAPGEPVADAEPGALPVGFLGLSQFPQLLSEPQADGKSLLFHLFRPQPEARRLFDLLTIGMDGAAELPSPPRPWPVIKLAARLLTRVARGSRRRAILGVLPGLVIVVLGLAGLIATFGGFGLLISVVMILLGILTALLGLVIALLTALLDDLKQLPAVGFGISSGRGEAETDLALTPWLYGRLQELAGRPVDQPLTFGDLSEQGIDFRVMTTNLSRAQPIAMPWSDDTYFFEPAEFRKLFGDVVVQAMLDHPPPLPAADSDRRPREALLALAGTKRPLPRAADLPIIVATRMSLSFPLLISAVPLYSVDFTRTVNSQYAMNASAWLQQNPDAAEEDIVAAVAPPEFDVNWFSDGGLTANLPVQFFDAPLPTRPTFAMDLAGFSADHPRSSNESDNSYLPTENQGGLHRRTARWKPEPVSQLVSFGFVAVRNRADLGGRVVAGDARLSGPGGHGLHRQRRGRPQPVDAAAARGPAQ